MNLNSKPERLPDRLRSPLMKTALVIVGLLALLGVTVGWAIWGWQQTAGTAMGFHGWLAMILGVVFTVVVGCGLMGLMFYSSRYGYDERATDLSDKDKSER
jgi:sterol desaturase/sphingolipid hydroxylase (fatty acid hydroxylase superfamily)